MRDERFAIPAESIVRLSRTDDERTPPVVADPPDPVTGDEPAAGWDAIA